MSCTARRSADAFAEWQHRSRTVVDVDLLIDGVGLVELDFLVVEEEEVFLVVLLIFVDVDILVVVETFVELLILVELVFGAGGGGGGVHSE